ncbi:putative basic amino acid antiporter YfcC [Acidaminobacter sp. JC074]|uniref:YfcC family protein n=1 Tax=Acidaminobacter sp. JC074 TaxID=2530199 RepID=UPI001F0FDC73|nr:AbgT family transporter [Acidaminobacter sp. JC074]MCH4886308.1 putative basic amino acid antiporter YfcC [Acidaminobacter sp. JC074]
MSEVRKEKISKKPEIKKKKIPHTFVLLFAMVLICSVLTYIIPAGEFDRMTDEVTGKTIIVEGSYHTVDRSPTGIMDFFVSFYAGSKAASGIIFFIFFIAGAFGIINETGFINASLNRVVSQKKKNPMLLIVIITIIFSVAGGTFGISEEAILFIPIAISLFMRLGLDSMIGLVVISVGARIGFTTGLLNPFTVGVAQGIAEVPLFSGLAYRIVFYVLILAVSIVYILRYAKKIQKDPKASLVYDLDQTREIDDAHSDIEYLPRHNAIGLVIVAGLSLMVFGVMKFGWYFSEIVAIFLGIGIISGIIGKMSADDIAKSFIEGAKDLVFGALIVGVARAILVVLQDGMIIDTIIYHASEGLKTLPPVVAANGMYVFQLLLNVIIPSGSGQAAATMPIMAPLADLLGISRQTAVLAFHYGDGFTNLISPTNGTLMASLAIAKISYEKWAKWMWPLLLMWMVIGMASVTIATIINLGPI